MYILGIMSFDIVIPVGPNDYDIFRQSIEYTKKNVLGYRHIYIVSSEPFDVPGCITISDSVFPYTREYIGQKVGYIQRAGWYLQQIIKMTAGIHIEDILDSYLVLDSDVFILKPTQFMKNGLPMFAYSGEHHLPYFQHMARLHPSLTRQQNKSGICHHMIFNKGYLRELFALVESHTATPFIDSFLDRVRFRGPDKSGASEYEIYFNFMIKYHPDNMIIRQLQWRNVGSLTDATPGDDYVAVHHYLRPR